MFPPALAPIPANDNTPATPLQLRVPVVGRVGAGDRVATFARPTEWVSVTLEARHGRPQP